MQPFTFFISYRRHDTGPVALLLKHEIETRLRYVRVFLDVADVQIGTNFPDRLRVMIDRSHATIALIGRHWMMRTEEIAHRSESSAPSSDWVVQELEYSRTAPLSLPAEDCHGLRERKIIPLCVDCHTDFGQFSLPSTLNYLKSLNATRIDYARWRSSIGPLLDEIAAELSQNLRPEIRSFPIGDPGKARTQAVSDQELIRILDYRDYSGWYIDNFGEAEARYLAKTFEFASFDAAANFMSLVSEYCRVLDHHPEWKNIFGNVHVSLSTWDAKNRVTIYDLNLALYMNKAAQAVAAGKVSRGNLRDV